MRQRAIILAAGLATLALAGCAVPSEDYAYDPYAGRHYDPHSGRYYTYEPAHARRHHDHRYAYAWDPARGQWDYRENRWLGSRWDSSPYDRYNRARHRLDREDP